MTAVFHLADVFQKIINRFYHRPFSQQQLVLHIHQNVLHIFSQLGYQLDALPVQALKQSLRDIPPIPEELPVQFAAQPADNVDALAGRELVNAETGTRAQVSTR